MEPKEPKRKEQSENSIPFEGFTPPIPSADKTRHTALIGQILKGTQGAFLEGYDWYKGNQTTEEDFDIGIEWLQDSLIRGGNTVSPALQEPYLEDIGIIVQIDRTAYNPSSLDKKKRIIMERVNAVQDYLARGVLTGHNNIFDKLHVFLHIFDSFRDRTTYSSFFIKAIIRDMGRLLANIKSFDEISDEAAPDIYNELKEVHKQAEGLRDPFEGYRSAILYDMPLAYFVVIVKLYEEFNYLDRKNLNEVVNTVLIPMEVNLERYKHFGTGANTFIDPSSYEAPQRERMDEVLGRLTNTKTNILPGGSENAPVDYQVQISEGMRMRDVWGITKAHIVGMHPNPVTDQTPLFLHIALERSQEHAPIYGYYNLRTGKFRFLMPDIAGISGKAELHLFVYSLITDLRHYERQGISIQKEGEEHHPVIGERMKIPIKRSFVIGKQGIIEEPKPEPTGSVYITPRKATLPYGSQLVAALTKLDLAKGSRDQNAIDKAQAEVDRLKKHLPTATEKNLQRYRQKAEALGLDPGLIVVREERITEAPRQGFDQPIFTTNPPQKREIRVLPSFGSQLLRVNELFSAPDNVDVVFSGEQEHQATKEQPIAREEAQEDLPPQTTWRRFMKHFRFGRRDSPPSQ